MDKLFSDARATIIVMGLDNFDSLNLGFKLGLIHHNFINPINPSKVMQIF